MSTTLTTVRTPVTVRVARHALPALAATLALILAGCGTDEPDVEPADRALGNALSQMREASTGSFGFVLGNEGDEALRTEGSYDLANETSRFTVTTDGGGDLHRIEQVSGTDGVWVQAATASNGDPCWMHLGPGLADPEQLGSPAYVEVALSGEAGEWIEPGLVMSGTADLRLVVNTLGDAAGELEVDPDSTARTEVNFLLDDGEMNAWRTDMVSVLTTLRDSGVELSAEMDQLVETGVDVPVMGWFSDLGSEVDHSPPAAVDVVQVNRRAGLAAATQACAAR